ncbi:Targeting protein for Xklp2-like protein [Zancudomyces culisetae]|uniref:Targeting protein for Xklp2-like protein n=1 Tax=Zancudomyces culisetae TaxID=1213189 RepID=A0A1R1PMN3_ZANCU|nr:Targeting protein for Xklp2-like protein [Zancudomyces culisetae]|eukprot:OMH82231.1 Targeting protein for Xklp2-like protein [Zancudomyces culisetae]
MEKSRIQKNGNHGYENPNIESIFEFNAPRIYDLSKTPGPGVDDWQGYPDIQSAGEAGGKSGHHYKKRYNVTPFPKEKSTLLIPEHDQSNESFSGQSKQSAGNRSINRNNNRNRNRNSVGGRNVGTGAGGSTATDFVSPKVNRRITFELQEWSAEKKRMFLGVDKQNKKPQFALNEDNYELKDKFKQNTHNIVSIELNNAAESDVNVLASESHDDFERAKTFGGIKSSMKQAHDSSAYENKRKKVGWSTTETPELPETTEISDGMDNDKREQAIIESVGSENIDILDAIKYGKEDGNDNPSNFDVTGVEANDDIAREMEQYTCQISSLPQEQTVQLETEEVTPNKISQPNEYTLLEFSHSDKGIDKDYEIHDAKENVKKVEDFVEEQGRKDGFDECGGKNEQEEDDEDDADDAEEKDAEEEEDDEMFIDVKDIEKFKLDLQQRREQVREFQNEMLKKVQNSIEKNKQERKRKAKEDLEREQQDECEERDAEHFSQGDEVVEKGGVERGKKKQKLDKEEGHEEQERPYLYAVDGPRLINRPLFNTGDIAVKSKTTPNQLSNEKTKLRSKKTTKTKVPREKELLTIAEPFIFETDKIAERKLSRLREYINAAREKEQKLRHFTAQPMPVFSTPKLPPKAVRPSVEPEPFRLLVDQRGMEYQRRLAEKQEKLEQLRRARMQFKANPVPESTYFYHQPTDTNDLHVNSETRARPLTETLDIHLNTEARTQQRNLWNEAFNKRQTEQELQLERERQARLENERLNIARLRAAIVHKPLPVPDYTNPLVIKPSDRPTTVPITPPWDKHN